MKTWLKYRRGFANGYGEWLWRYLGEGCATLGITHESDLQADQWCLKEVVDEINDEFDWSDKYRGIDYEVVESPPSDVIKDKLKSCVRELAWRQRHIVYLTELLNTVEALEKFENLEDAEPHSWKPDGKVETKV